MPGVTGYSTALSRALASAAVDTVGDSKVIGRIFDFLSYATDVPVNFIDLINEASDAGRLIGFVTRMNDILSGTLATANVQAITNVINASGQPDRGFRFLGDVLSALFHGIEGTSLGINSDVTDLSHKTGAAAWPAGGFAGRGIEISLDSTDAFTFLQKVLLDDVLSKATKENKPIFGYISVRVCPRTQTLLGMQQFERSVMIEVVAYRSPEANAIMDRLQKKAKAFTGLSGQKPLLHWGLENDQVDSAFLALTPLGQPYKGAFTRLTAFKAIRSFLRKGHPPVFDNVFTARTGL
jgi:hypothetical protein